MVGLDAAGAACPSSQTVELVPVDSSNASLAAHGAGVGQSSTLACWERAALLVGKLEEAAVEEAVVGEAVVGAVVVGEVVVGAVVVEVVVGEAVVEAAVVCCAVEGAIEGVTFVVERARKFVLRASVR